MRQEGRSPEADALDADGLDAPPADHVRLVALSPRVRRLDVQVVTCGGPALEIFLSK